MKLLPESSLLAFICSKLTKETLDQGVKYVQNKTIKTPERRNWHHWRRFSVFIVNYEHISQLFLVYLLLTLNIQLPTRF